RENALRRNGFLPASTTTMIPPSRTRCGRRSSPTRPSGTGHLEGSAQRESRMSEELAKDLQARLSCFGKLAAHVQVRGHVGVPAERVLALALRHLQVDAAQDGLPPAHARADDG